MKKKMGVVIFTFLFTLAVLVVGYMSFGIWTTFIFMSGFLGGFILWMFMPMEVSFSSIKIPYWITMSFFLLHRIEENVFKFQQELSKITKVPVPKVTSLPLIVLVLVSIGGWLLVPILVKHGNALGYYLAWTFFAALEITELAHFIFPFLVEEPYGYFPGMVSVFLLAPPAGWGMWRLSRKNL